MDTKIDKNIVEIAKKVLKDESEAIYSLINTIDDTFEKITKLILSSKGKIIITGIGKSAIIGQKIVATLNSTGQKAVFMHATDAIHGDLGIIDTEDILIFISKSGNTPEIKVLIPLLKNIKIPIIAIVSDINSYLAQQSNFIINAHVTNEACPINLAPTSSTTVALVLGDALAVCLMEARNFKKEDFAVNHPGGSLGKKLYLKVDDLMLLHETPIVHNNDNIEKVILEMTSKRLGCTTVLNENNDLMGIITDGDLRRMLKDSSDFKMLKASEIMNSNAKIIQVGEYAVNAMIMMQEMSISQLVVVENKKVKGIVHIHDLLKEGLV